MSLDKWILDSRLKAGIKVFSRKAGLREAMYFLRQKNWLTILFLTKNSGINGVDTLFLNRVASITNLPDIMARINDIRIFYACPKKIGIFQTQLFLKEIFTGNGISACEKAHEHLAQDIHRCSKGFPEWLWSHGKWKVHYSPKARFNLISKRSNLQLNNLCGTGSRIVIRLPNWLGDVVMALPILRALRGARGHEIYYFRSFNF